MCIDFQFSSYGVLYFKSNKHCLINSLGLDLGRAGPAVKLFSSLKMIHNNFPTQWEAFLCLAPILIWKYSRSQKVVMKITTQVQCFFILSTINHVMKFKKKSLHFREQYHTFTKEQTGFDKTFLGIEALTLLKVSFTRASWDVNVPIDFSPNNFWPEASFLRLDRDV